jgi:60 kDa SS-A/Ro ribonucleoprotein
VPFRMLAGLPLTQSHWAKIVRDMPWNTLRLNLNTAARHKVFGDREMTDYVVAKLGDPAEVRRHNVFPYQLLTAFQNLDDGIPPAVRNALQDAMELACDNVPKFEGGVVACIDTSYSMQHPITGQRDPGATSKTRCIDVAALIGASLVRKDPLGLLLPFDTTVHSAVAVNPRDSIMTNATKLAQFGGGGTDCASALRTLNGLAGNRPRAVVYVSDNESWYNPAGTNRFGLGTGMAAEWLAYRRKVPRAKLVCIDLVTNATTQVLDDHDVLNIGGFSDAIWPVIDRFVRGERVDFVGEIEAVDLDGHRPAAEPDSEQ